MEIESPIPGYSYLSVSLGLDAKSDGRRINELKDILKTLDKRVVSDIEGLRISLLCSSDSTGRSAKDSFNALDLHSFQSENRYQLAYSQFRDGLTSSERKTFDAELLDIKTTTTHEKVSSHEMYKGHESNVYDDISRMCASSRSESLEVK